MATSTIYTPVKQAGNGSATAFAFSFKILASSDLAVYKQDAAGVITKGVLNVDYTVTFDSTAENGTVTYTVAPVSSGYSIIARASNETQGTVWPREGTAPAKNTETALDKLTLLVQELFKLISFAPTYAASSVAPPALTIVNPPVDEMALVWESNGDGTFSIASSAYDPDTQQAAAAASAAAALVSQSAAAASAAAALVSQNAAAASAAAVNLIYSHGTAAARPASPATAVIYASTDTGAIEIWSPELARWALFG